MTPIRKILRNAGLLFSSQIVAGIAALVQGVIIARSLGASDYGVMGVAMAYALMVYRLFDCRVWEAITIFIPQFRQRDEHESAEAILRFCIWIELATGFFAAAAVWLSADWAGRTIFNGSAPASVIRLAGVLVVLRIPFEITKALLRLADRFELLAKQTAAMAVVQLLMVLVVCRIDPTVRCVLIVHLASTALSSAIFMVTAVSIGRQLDLHILRSPRWSALHGHWREFLSFLLLTNLNATWRFANKLDLIILGWFGTMSDVGIYQVARKATQFLVLPASALRQAIFPEMSKLAADENTDQLKHLPLQLTRLISICIIPGCLFGTIAAPWVIPWIWGGEFARATLLAQLLVWNALGLSLVWFQPFLLSTGRARAVVVVQIAMSAVYVGMLVCLTHTSGAIGTAVAHIVRIPVKATLIWITLHLPIRAALRSRNQK